MGFLLAYYLAALGAFFPMMSAVTLPIGRSVGFRRNNDIRLIGDLYIARSILKQLAAAALIVRLAAILGAGSGLCIDENQLMAVL